MRYQHNSNKFHDVKTLVASKGGWRFVIGNYPNLLDAMSSRTEKPCPKASNPKKNSTKFRPFKNWEDTGGAWHNDTGALADGIELLSWYTGQSKSETLDEIIRICGGEIPKFTDEDRKAYARQMQVKEEITPEESAKRQAIISQVMAGARPLAGTAGEVYLRNRGMKGDLSVFGRNLMFHPNLKYCHHEMVNGVKQNRWKSYPGLVAVIRDGNGIGLTLHRTFLKPDGSGKADVENQKMMLKQPRPLDGGYIALDKPVLTPHGKAIGVCEGLETGLSIREATGCPMRVGISDRIMENMKFEDDISHVFIWADLDVPTEQKPAGAGMAAATALKTRLESEGKCAIILVPNQFGREKMDWNDVYQEFGFDGFLDRFQPEYRVYTGVEIPE